MPWADPGRQSCRVGGTESRPSPATASGRPLPLGERAQSRHRTLDALTSVIGARRTSLAGSSRPAATASHPQRYGISPGHARAAGCPPRGTLRASAACAEQLGAAVGLLLQRSSVGTAAHDQLRDGVASTRLELRLLLRGGVSPCPLVRQRRAGDAAAQSTQLLAVVCLHAHRGMQADPVDVGTRRLARHALARHCPPQGQDLLPDARPKGHAVSHGRGLQRPQRTRLVPVGIRLGEVLLPQPESCASPAATRL